MISILASAVLMFPEEETRSALFCFEICLLECRHLLHSCVLGRARCDRVPTSALELELTVAH